MQQSIKDQFTDRTKLTTEEAQALEDLVKQLDVGDNSINKFLAPISQVPAGFALAAGTVALKQKMARVKINTEVRVKWSGLSSRVERRAVYKVLSVTANVDSADAQKWAALLACIAGSTRLGAFLWGLAFGPVGWAI